MSDRRFDWIRIVCLALAVAGLLLGNWLVQIEAGRAQAPEWACGGPRDCHIVLASPYSKMFQLPPFPVPISTGAMGMAYFMVLGVWLLLVGRLPGRLHHTWAAPALIGLGGALGSLSMIYVMGWILEAWCGLCLFTHLANFPLVAGVWLLWIAGRPSRAPGAGPVGQTVAAEALLTAGAGGSTSGGGAAETTSEQIAEPDDDPAIPANGTWKIPAMALLAGLAVGLALLRASQTSEAIKMVDTAAMQYDYVTNDDAYRKYLFLKSEKVDIPIGPHDPTLGPADAEHTLVVFSDFDCSHCAEFAALVPKIQQGQSEPIRVVYKYFPLSAACNPTRPNLPGMDAYENSCEAALAAEAARRLGGDEAFWKAHDLLFAARHRLGSVDYGAMAVSLGLDPQAFDRLRHDADVMARVRQTGIEGASVGVRSTPAIFLDGRRIQAPWKNSYDRQLHRRRMNVPQTLEYWKHLLQWSQEAQAPAPATQPAE